jgi:RNA polymerase sigma-70 factor (ECF subfamily)
MIRKSTRYAARDARLTAAMGRYVDGDAAAFDAVWRDLSGQVHSALRRMAGPALADDLLQQTFLKVHLNRHRYTVGAPVGPWVLTIARNLATDALRKRGRSKEQLTFAGELPEPGVSDGADQRATIEAVRHAVAGLPEGQRKVIELHKLGEQTFDEVAQTLGIRAGAARVRAHRAYATLRTLLTPALAA